MNCLIKLTKIKHKTRLKRSLRDEIDTTFEGDDIEWD